ncbi:hypothetical protein DEO72_LG2g2695 [Vigna unguiculata]|uniref:Uncharacterized protein n=1 Tax=Vigna unguiculata TaxID=3917 RepID=A0A4D6L1I9_VIGUN|nr:hypothetical protein DEO72_LG2g2695 [Vigna unguiculata]
MHVNQSGRATSSSSSISQNGTLTLIFLLSYHHHGSRRPPFTAIHGSRRQHLHQSRQLPSQPPSASIANLQPLKPSTAPHSSATTTLRSTASAPRQRAPVRTSAHQIGEVEPAALHQKRCHHHLHSNQRSTTYLRGFSNIIAQSNSYIKRPREKQKGQARHFRI